MARTADGPGHSVFVGIGTLVRVLTSSLPKDAVRKFQFYRSGGRNFCRPRVVRCDPKKSQSRSADQVTLFVECVVDGGVDGEELSCRILYNQLFFLMRLSAIHLHA